MKPWSKMAGGMTQDALGEIEVVNKLTDKLSMPSQPHVKVRCKKCQALNDETDKFCFVVNSDCLVFFHIVRNRLTENPEKSRLSGLFFNLFSIFILAFDDSAGY